MNELMAAWRCSWLQERNLPPVRLCAQRQRLSSGGILIASKAISQEAGGMCPGLAGMEGISKADEGDLRSRGLH